MTHFRHLNQAEISNIILAVQAGESRAAIARRHHIDHSTVNYHLTKYEKSYPEQSGVYAVIRASVKKQCAHPSYKCSLCGFYQDAITRGEKRIIRDLRADLKTAHDRLLRAGL